MKFQLHYNASKPIVFALNFFSRKVLTLVGDIPLPHPPPWCPSKYYITSLHPLNRNHTHLYRHKFKENATYNHANDQKASFRAQISNNKKGSTVGGTFPLVVQHKRFPSPFVPQLYKVSVDVIKLY